MTIKSNFFLLALFSILLFISACQALLTSEDRTQPGLSLKECQLISVGMTTRIPAKCGLYEVYEDRIANSGRKIQLNLAVIPAVSRSPAADPVFFLAGGPGEAATQSFLYVYSAMNQINQKRDIVLVDQRGTGKSNPLACSLDGSQEPESDIETKTYAENCLRELEADPSLYTTSIAMDDLDEVRQALGYDQINLYGASYGTRAAMVYARQHPESVRTIILDGVVPLDWILGPAVAGDAQQALDLIFGQCKVEKACSEAFPNIENEFQTILEHLRDKPVHISLSHPSSGEIIEMTLTLESFVNTIHMMSYAPETASLLPMMIHQAYSYDDFSALAAQTLSTTERLDGLISIGMRFSVICSEDQPFYAQEPSSEGYLGNQFENIFNEVCAVWPAEPITSEFHQPLVSDIPTLILSGEFDPVTPPANGESTAKTLSNSLHITAPYQGHINLFRGCLPTLAEQFIESASVQILETTCVQQLKPAPFFINLNGPQP